MTDSSFTFWNAATAADFDRRTVQSGRFGAIRRLADVASPYIRSGLVSVDLGCGTGLLAEYTRRREIIGVDFSESLAKVARTRMESVIVGDALDPPFAESSVDNVFSLFVLDDYPDAVKTSFLATVGKILKPEGRLFLATYSPADERMGARCKTINAGLRQHFNVHLRPIGYYREQLRIAGFRVEHDEGYRCAGTYSTPDGDVPVRREFILMSGMKMP